MCESLPHSVPACRNGVTGTPGRRRHAPVDGDQTSPCLLPVPPLHEPPSVSTAPSCSGVLELWPRVMFILPELDHAPVAGS